MNLKLRIRRTEGWREYEVDLAEGAYVLDALEAAARQDPGVLFRHSCHHASCGSCGLRINGREKLACITPAFPTAGRKHVLVLEPLRNFPLMRDLVVDFRPLTKRMQLIDLSPVQTGEWVAANGERLPESRLEACIECGLCISACPVMGSDEQYWGPAPLAELKRWIEERPGQKPGNLSAGLKGDHGIWRCHAVFECTQVCPNNVDPAGAIMALRQKLIKGELQ